MHETVLASSILKIVLESAGQYSEPEQALQVTGISLQVGLLSCLEPQTLTGCFEIMAEGTAAQGARLEVIMQPLSGHCSACGPVTTQQRKFACPICGQSTVEWEGGHEMLVSAIKVAKPD